MLGVGWRVNVKDGERDGIKVHDVKETQKKKEKKSHPRPACSRVPWKESLGKYDFPGPSCLMILEGAALVALPPYLA